MVESFCLLVGTPKFEFELGSPGLRIEDEAMINRICAWLEASPE